MAVGLSAPTERVRRVCFPFAGDSVGGSYFSALLLMRELRAFSCEPLVVLHGEGPFADLLERERIGYRILPLPALAGSSARIADIAGAAIRSARPLRKFLREQRIDLVHTNDLRMHLTWPLATRLAGARFICHQRIVLSRSPYWQILARAAHRIVCVSRAVFDTLPAAGRRRAAIIANPIAPPADLDRVSAHAALRRELGLTPQTKVVGYVGNMLRQKRPLVFLEAAAKVRAAVPGPLAFVMAGDNRGGELDAVRRRAGELGLAEQVHAIGFRTPIEPFIAGCDVLVAPGIADGFGRTLAEAMVVGTPVVASASGGHVELLEHGALGALVGPDDPAAFAGGVVRFLQHPDAAESIAQAARTRANEKYAPRAHAAQVAAQYDLALRS